MRLSPYHHLTLAGLFINEQRPSMLDGLLRKGISSTNSGHQVNAILPICQPLCLLPRLISDTDTHLQGRMMMV